MVKQRFERDKLFVMGNCVSLIEELKKYRWSTEGRSPNAAKETVVKRDDDLVDPLRYIAMSHPLKPPREMQEQYLSAPEKALRRAMRGRDRRHNLPWHLADVAQR